MLRYEVGVLAALVNWYTTMGSNLVGNGTFVGQTCLMRSPKNGKVFTTDSRNDHSRVIWSEKVHVKTLSRENV